MNRRLILAIFLLLSLALVFKTWILVGIAGYYILLSALLGKLGEN